MAWLVVLLLPMLALVQAVAASVAGVSHLSLQQAIGRTYGRAAAMVCALAILPIGLLTLAADVQAGAAALTLLSGVPFYYFVVPMVVAACWLLATHSYLRIERTLAWLTLIFLCYVASAIYARPNWGEILHDILVPHLELSPGFAAGALALLGTTLTSYVYFWESIEIAERRPQRAALRSITTDAVVGMLVAGSSFLFILIATAATAGREHAAITTAADAAIALKPLAGRWDQALFGIGLFASAAIAIPVIAATNGYVLAQTFERRASLTLEPSQAKTFYAGIFASLLLAGTLALLPIPTLTLLYWVSVVAGIATPITLAFSMLVARNRTLMQGRPVGIPLAIGGWVVTAIVTLSVAGFTLAAVRAALHP